MLTLQTGCAHKLELLKVSAIKEKDAQNTASTIAIALKGEWFTVNKALLAWIDSLEDSRDMDTPNRAKERVAYSFVEFAEMVGKERTWVYRQVEKGRIRAITGFGVAMIPASEIDRIFGANSHA
tara:strand:- start:2067 stop:2438 length:372 start_codon:yes stop_codon:yes gene_type:complete